MIPYAVSIRYMIAGYAVIFVIFGIYLISLVWRWRKINRDLKVLEDINVRLDQGDK